MATASVYAKIAFAVFARDSDGDDEKSYSLKEIFTDESDPDDFGYGTGRTTILRMT